MRTTTENMIRIFGDRWYGELQWNDVPQQHELNQYIIQMKNEYDITLDLYGRQSLSQIPTLGRIGNYISASAGSVASAQRPDWICPTSYPLISMLLVTNLYPKNGDQMWESYTRSTQRLCKVEYDDALVLRVAHRNSSTLPSTGSKNFEPDTSIKLPDFVVPEGATAEDALQKMAIDSLRTKKLHENARVYMSD